jgi:hypothetical protein
MPGRKEARQPQGVNRASASFWLALARQGLSRSQSRKSVVIARLLSLPLKDIFSDARNETDHVDGSKNEANQSAKERRDKSTQRSNGSDDETDEKKDQRLF